MEWIRISANKLKIMLTAEDARHYDLDCRESTFSDTATRTVFREILSDVYRETGFEASAEKTYIQMYPSKEGGCELFITKTGLVLTSEEEKSPRTVAKYIPRLSSRQRNCTLAYLFGELAHLLIGCRALQRESNALTSDAYHDDKGQWWLTITPQEGFQNSRLAPLDDLGRRVPFENAQIFLLEHATKICSENALDTLGAL